MKLIGFYMRAYKHAKIILTHNIMLMASFAGQDTVGGENKRKMIVIIGIYFLLYHILKCVVNDKLVKKILQNFRL